MGDQLNSECGIIAAISVSAKRGEKKHNIQSAELRVNWGIVGDAHAGSWDRQISILALESFDQIREMGMQVEPGNFAENLTIKGIDLAGLRVGAQIGIGEAVLEVTKIGKECHNRCAIYDAVGDCIMPREGVFAKVLKGGYIRVGQEIRTIRKVDKMD